ncbi:conserved exported hypothetical protein [Candidatus Desulfarcum epimagneticum]|uniref:Autotransporter domain-containing protein n=1 Tax=uncultured Desulfobacteraceae bacterium TaxID=218296 RepID=A0A484HID1_9BACT|nr:conserved exported hypothetical protein [uncultured Desulfobacteraceae bacterium]
MFKNLFVALSFLGTMYISSIVFAGESESETDFFKTHTWEAGIELASYEYGESTEKHPDFVNHDGLMKGFMAAYAYRDPTDIVLKAEFAASFGDVDYQSAGTGSDEGIDQYMHELRGVLGYDFDLHDSLSITPYTGFGYRYLVNDSSGMRSTSGHLGYKRESHYYYSPLGVEAVKRMENGWELAVSAEYDFLWKGKQISHVGFFYPNLGGAAENKQDSGYGLRASVKIIRRTNLTFVLEPFIRFWSVDISEPVVVPDTPGPGWVTTIYEPENETTEIGVRLYIRF